MHEASAAWVRRFARSPDQWVRPTRVVDLGGRDVNGAGRALWELVERRHALEYYAIDRVAAPGVDVVADVTNPAFTLHACQQVEIETPFNVVVCTSVFEHEQAWDRIIATAGVLLRPGGLFIVTTVRAPFPVHSGIDGCMLRAGEWYDDIDPMQLLKVAAFNFDVVSLDTTAEGDVMYAGRRRVDPPERRR